MVRQAVIRLLRGEYNSVRHRFIRLPKEWV